VSINATMISAGRKDFALNPAEEATLREITTSLASAVPALPSTLPATAASPTPQPVLIPDYALALILKLVTQWPDSDRLPGLDLLRCITPSPSAAGLQDPQFGSLIDVALTAAFDTGGKINENCAMMTFRAIANAFYSEAGRVVAAANADKVVGYMEGVVGIDDSIVKGPIGQTNRNLGIALTTAAINYAVLAHATQKRGVKGTSPGPEVLGLMGNVLGRILLAQRDQEVTYRALTALGTIAAIGGEYKDALKSLGAEKWAKGAVAEASEDRVKKIGEEASTLLQ